MPIDPSNPPHDLHDRTDTGLSELGEFDSMNMPFVETGNVDLLLNELAPRQPWVPVPKARSALIAGQRSGGGRPVLVVDSAAIARKFLSARLSALGYDVHLAETGEQALAMTGQQRYTVVFTETVFGPGSELDGLHLCQTLKQGRDGSAPAVVMITGQTGSSDKVRGALAGCNAYLNKPLVDADFIAALIEVDPLFQ